MAMPLHGTQIREANNGPSALGRWRRRAPYYVSISLRRIKLSCWGRRSSTPPKRRAVTIVAFSVGTFDYNASSRFVPFVPLGLYD